MKSHPEQLGGYHTLLHAWDLPTHRSSRIQDAACRLCNHITSSGDGTNCIWGIIHGLNVFFREVPTSIDFGTDAFRTTSAILPRFTQEANLMTPTGVGRFLESFLIDHAQSFQGMLSRDGSAGKT